MNYKCVIFDCDGVLVDSEALSARVFQKMIADLGFDIDFKTVFEQIIGTSMKENLKFFRDIIGRELPENFEQDFRKRSYEVFKTDLQPVKGVKDIFDKLKIPVAVASSGPSEKIKLNLTTTKLIDYFGENIFSCYDIGSWKPEPQIYLHAAEKMGFKPGECAVIEDSVPGIQAAKAGGFDVFALDHHNNKILFEENGATVFYEMKELGNLLGFD